MQSLKYNNASWNEYLELVRSSQCDWALSKFVCEMSKSMEVDFEHLLT